MVTVLGEHGGIGGHLDDVAITLDISQIEGFGKGCLHVGALGIGRSCIFAKIDLGSVAVIVVVIVAMVHEPTSRLIVVLIDHILQVRVFLGEGPAFEVVGRRRVEGAHGTTDLDFRIFGTDGLADHLVTLLEDGGDDILVANADILQVERLWMSCVSTHPGPFRSGGVAIGPVDEVEQFLDIGWHILHGDASLLTSDALTIIVGVLAGHSSSEYGQRLCSDVLTELEVLEEA